MTASARDVAAALRDRLPGLSTTKLHKLLYYCQGHHLAAFGEPLFAEPIAAWDLGPVVASLWREEKHGPLEPEEAVPALRELGEAELNTIGYVVHRYGALSAGDLIRLTHSESPWKAADGVRQSVGEKTATIDLALIEKCFENKEAEDEAERPQVNETALARLLAEGHARRDEPARLDSREEILRG